MFENRNIKIAQQMTVRQIQEEFNKAYPYLKIEFFSKPHQKNGASPKNLIVQKSKTLGECRTIHNEGEITITPQMIVADLEQNFMDVYGLSVQVFRKSGNAWLETTITDGWTLEKQNLQGEVLSKKSTEAE